MQRTILAIVFAVVSAFFLSCDVFGGKPDYFPISIGSTWNWFSCVVLASGTDAPPDTLQVGNMTTKATRNEKLASGEDVVELVKVGVFTNRYPRESTYTIYDTCYVRELSNMILSYDSKDDAEPETTLALPLAAGKTWRVTQELFAKALLQEDVTVRAGSYQNAWKIEMSEASGADTFRMFYWYANKVGNIKYHSEQDVGTSTFIYHGELVSAIIK